MDKPLLVGWYECRFIRNSPDARVARYWDGKQLRFTPSDKTGCAVAEYVDFRGPLIDDHPAATALAFLLVKLGMRQLDAALIKRTCEEAIAKCKGDSAVQPSGDDVADELPEIVGGAS